MDKLVGYIIPCNQISYSTSRGNPLARVWVKRKLTITGNAYDAVKKEKLKAEGLMEKSYVPEDGEWMEINK